MTMEAHSNSPGWYFGFLVEYGFVLKPTVNRVKQIFIPKPHLNAHAQLVLL